MIGFFLSWSSSILASKFALSERDFSKCVVLFWKAFKKLLREKVRANVLLTFWSDFLVSFSSAGRIDCMDQCVGIFSSVSDGRNSFPRRFSKDIAACCSASFSPSSWLWKWGNFFSIKNKKVYVSFVSFSFISKQLFSPQNYFPLSYYRLKTQTCSSIPSLGLLKCSSIIVIQFHGLEGKYIFV